MKSIKFELNTKGFMEQVLKSNGMQEAVQNATDGIRSRCGDGYEASTTLGRNRVLGMVWPDTYEAMVDNSDNNTLLKAVK